METSNAITRNNTRILVECISELETLQFVDVGDEVDLFIAPLLWLANCIYAATSVSLIKMLEVAATVYGLVVRSGVEVSEAVFETRNPRGSGQWTVSIIDPVVPKSAEEAKSFDPLAPEVRIFM